MEVGAALTASALLAALGMLQVAAAAGAPVGRFLWGGQHRHLPTRLRIGSAMSVLVYALVAAVLLARADLVDPGPGAWVDVGAWVLTGYFALGVLVNALSRSRAERAAMVPACVLLAVCAGLVAGS